MHYLISYPKSGRTWIRFMFNMYVGKYYGFKGKNVFEVERKIPPEQQIKYTHLNTAFTDRVPYHAIGAVNAEKIRRRETMVLARSIFDTLKSAFFHCKYRLKTFNGEMSEFIREPNLGAVKIISFYNLVHDLKKRFRSYTVFRYEDMVRDTEKELGRLIETMGLKTIGEIISETVEAGKFENLRRLSIRKEYRETCLSPGAAGVPESYKVRNGNKPENVYSSEDIEYLNQMCKALLYSDIFEKEYACQMS